MTHALTFLKGMLVGIANIIPGVSGGTFALILGIYERLLKSIAGFGIRSVKLLFGLITHPGNKESRTAFGQEMKRTDASWLLLLMLGAAVAILASSRLIAMLLDEHRAPTLAFFIGLIVPSILVPYGLLNRKGIKEALSCLIAAAALICLTIFFKPATGGTGNLITLFIAGAIA
ncbi:MAG: DUF368 domain-containing protein, partial [Deltaproteobacteria bacterium]|nr:DUF368 domain-containing protein [Deltaproteobacteria bacterium]